ncbi:MAG: helix-turn-helix transcriptional regulator [Clostridia bacterium]|nr:helix-turn-helix transcriptional regulator [Clostridia bacterium]
MHLPIEYCSYKIDRVSAQGAAPHTHSFRSEIIQTFENEGNILINGKLCKMVKNGLYFIYGPAIHFVVPEDLARYNHTLLSINIQETEKLCRHLNIKAEYDRLFTDEGGMFCPLTPEDVIRTDALFLEVNNIFKENTPMQYARLSAALVRLFEIGMTYAEVKTENNDKISDILSYISDNALNKITIDDICVHTKISKYHLCRIFKENIGVTIGEFIKRRRLTVAKNLLVQTDTSITEIAHKCCFSDNSFFSKTFSKEFGMSPSAYRSKYR